MKEIWEMSQELAHQLKDLPPGTPIRIHLEEDEDKFIRREEMSVLRELLSARGLTRVQTEIERVALPSIRLKAHAAEEAHLALGATRFGGSPDLPAEHAWPEHNGAPLPLVAQINLSEVVPYDTMHLLPVEGILSFFFDIDAFFDSWPRQQTVWRVLYSHAGAALERVSLSEREAKSKHYRPSTMTFSLEMTLPDYSQYDAASIQRLGLSGPLTQEEEKAYYEVQAGLAGTGGATSHIPLHRLLGHPDNVQWDMHNDLPGSPTDWQLLLQVDSDGVPNTEWGDTGRIYYWIRPRDLARRDFSQVMLLLQSS